MVTLWLAEIHAPVLDLDPQRQSGGDGLSARERMLALQRPASAPH
jgi:hypothetical protein